jgi:hypothetical protein
MLRTVIEFPYLPDNTSKPHNKKLCTVRSTRCFEMSIELKTMDDEKTVYSGLLHNVNDHSLTMPRILRRTRLSKKLSMKL